MATTKTARKPRTRTGDAPQHAAKTAKVFKNGRSQAVRLPKEFRFEGTEVAIRRNPATGEVVLAEAPKVVSQKKLSAEELFRIFDEAGFPDDFMSDREVHMPRKLDLF
jgi:antitoxin VapB